MIYNYNYSIFENISVISIMIFVLLILGFSGIFIIRSNLIITLISLEIILFIVNLDFIIFSNILDDILGQIYALLILSIAAAESSIGLALLVSLFRLRGLISIDFISILKG